MYANFDSTQGDGKLKVVAAHCLSPGGPISIRGADGQPDHGLGEDRIDCREQRRGPVPVIASPTSMPPYAFGAPIRWEIINLPKK
jgi:hypothetical protein